MPSRSAVLEALPLAGAVLAIRQREPAAPRRPLRPEQVAPPGDWRTWLIMAGRGFGKTLAGASDLARYGLDHPGSRLAIVARTYADVRDTCIEGESGLLSCLPPGALLNWNRSLGELFLHNGTRYKAFSADEPDRMRGPQHHRAWLDELASWERDRDAFDQVQFGLRLGSDPRCVVTTTPRPTKLIRELIEGTTTAVTRGTTYDNAANLAPAFLQQIIGRYEGTRLGRQELAGEVLDDIPGALWSYAMFDERRPAPDLVKVVVAIDPAASAGDESDETGIVVAGKGVDGNGYVLADRSCRLSPLGWARRAVAAYDEFAGGRIVAEVNNGGDMVEAVLRTVRPGIPYTKVHATRGKQIRAEPVAALYEQGKVFHVEQFTELEDQLVSWTPESGTSPDRLDALVWALSFLFPVEEEKAPGLLLQGRVKERAR